MMTMVMMMIMIMTIAHFQDDFRPLVGLDVKVEGDSSSLFVVKFELFDEEGNEVIPDVLYHDITEVVS